MKRTFKAILCAAAVVMAAVSCQKSAEPVQPAEKGKETIDICVNGLMGEYTQVDGTKAELVNTVRVSWKGGETVYVYDGTSCIGSLVASLEGTEDRYAVLSTDGDKHIINNPTEGTTKLTLVYSPLFGETAPVVIDGGIGISLAAQSGKKAPFVTYATLDYKGETSIKNAVVPFKLATSVIRVNCTGLKAGTAITSATLSNVNTECKLTLSGSAAPTISGGINGTITRTGDSYFAAEKVNAEGVAVFQIAVPVLDAVEEGRRTLSVTQDPDIFEYKKFSKKDLLAATSVNAVCQFVKKIIFPDGALSGTFSVSPTKKVHFSKGNLYCSRTSSSSNDWTWHFYSKQYECNSLNDKCKEGKRKAEIGDKEIDLFTWGFSDTTSLDPIGKNYVRAHPNKFDVLDYEDPSFDGGDDWGVAYCESNEVAVGTWRTLSTAEWQYLFNNHNRKWITVCGKTGYAIAPDLVSADAIAESYNTDDDWETAQDAGIVFLPVAGFREGSDVYNEGSIGSCYYWSSSAYDDEFAYDVCFNYVLVDSCYKRSAGFSVRLITESK